jgi:hypothetical protein
MRYLVVVRLNFIELFVLFDRSKVFSLVLVSTLYIKTILSNEITEHDEYNDQDPYVRKYTNEHRDVPYYDVFCLD